MIFYIHFFFTWLVPRQLSISSLNITSWGYLSWVLRSASSLLYFFMASYTSTLYRIWKSEGVFSVCWPHIHHFVNFTKVEMGLSSRMLNSQQSAQCWKKLVPNKYCVYAQMHACVNSRAGEFSPTEITSKHRTHAVLLPLRWCSRTRGWFWVSLLTAQVHPLSEQIKRSSYHQELCHSPVYTLDGKNVRELDHFQIYYLSL